LKKRRDQRSNTWGDARSKVEKSAAAIGRTGQHILRKTGDRMGEILNSWKDRRHVTLRLSTRRKRRQAFCGPQGKK